jgi:nitrous oxide reductase accessory protein NosL
VIRHATRAVVIALVLCVSCGDDESTPERSEVPAADFDGDECAACGMIVREQPSPRGQLVHADGTRLYFCSVADMVTYVESPSPHGSVVAAFVEQNDPDRADPLAYDMGRRPWIPTPRAHFVVGIERPRVMGRPVLSYATTEDASRVAERLGAETTTWNGLHGR